MLGPPWGTPAAAWVCDGRVIHVTEPALPKLVSLLLAYSPVALVCSTVRDREDSTMIVRALLDRTDPMCSAFLDDVADALCESWFGCPRWTAQEVWWRALGNWAMVDGELSMRGVDVMSMPAPRATNTIRALLLKWASGDESKMESLAHDFDTPPPRVAAKEAVREVAAEEAAFDWTAAAALASKHQ